MDLLIPILLVFGLMLGIFGTWVTIFTNCLLGCYCDWREGAEVDWAGNIGFTIATPFVYLFVIFEVYMLYCR